MNVLTHYPSDIHPNVHVYVVRPAKCWLPGLKYTDHEQGSAHTGWDWSAPTTIQPLLPSLKLFSSPLTGAYNMLKCDYTVAKA